jgi:hypothetical protein
MPHATLASCPTLPSHHGLRYPRIMPYATLASCPTLPSHHAPRCPRIMPDAALASCPTLPSHHAPRYPRIMPHAALASCPTLPSHHALRYPRIMPYAALACGHLTTEDDACCSDGARGSSYTAACFRSSRVSSRSPLTRARSCSSGGHRRTPSTSYSRARCTCSATSMGARLYVSSPRTARRSSRTMTARRL